MNPELQNYMRQAKLAGKSDEIITNELISGGWTPADVSEALGSQTAGVAGTSAVTVGTGGMGGGMMAIIAIVLIILGAGGYFMYSKKTISLSGQTSTTESVVVEPTLGNQPATPVVTPKPTTSNTTIKKAPFGCKDVFSDSDFLKIMKGSVADYPLTEEDKDGILSCSYKPLNDKLSLFDQKFKVLGFGISWDTGFQLSEKELFDGQKKMFSDTMKAHPEAKGGNLEVKLDFGYDAFDNGLQIKVLSSNQKYQILETVGKVEDFKAAAKIIDANLNKY
jgi:hypothetical protein